MGFEILTFFKLTRNKKSPCSTFNIKSTNLLFPHGSTERKTRNPCLMPTAGFSCYHGDTGQNGIGCLTLSCLPIYPMPSLKVFYQNMDYYNELNIYQKVLNEFRPNFAET